MTISPDVVERLRQSGIRIDREGELWHEGEVIRHGGLRAAIDPEAQGGAFLLGLRRLAVVPHGSFGAEGIARAIELAARGVRADVAGRTHARLAGAGALRRPGEPSAVAGTVPDS